MILDRWRTYQNRRKQGDKAARALYDTVVAQARDPEFYGGMGVADNVQGRFEMIVLHAFLLFRRLRGRSPESEARAQRVFQIMFADMDQSLRELGVGDMGVGRKIKGMAQGFYGRSSAYAKALENGDMAALRQALARNLFPDREPEPAQLERLASYASAQAAYLESQGLEDILDGRLHFLPVVENKS